MAAAARWLRLLGILGFIMALYFLAPVSSDPPAGLVARVGLAALLLGLVAVGMLVQLRLSASDADRRLDGLAAGIVGVVVTFAYAFYALDVHQPDQVAGLHTRLDALYFSASTTVTIGYGDVHATGQAARAVALVQMLFDVVFVAAAATLLTSRIRRRAEQRGAGTRPG